MQSSAGRVSVAFVVAATWATSAFAAEIDFNRDIRPILSDKCFHCHGPDPGQRQADMRLDLRDEAVGGGYVIVPGKPDESALIERVTSDDPDMVMPPPSTGKSVSAAEAALLRQWIEAGAPYATHWAFEPPTRPELPEVENDAWVQTPIDRFILHRLEQAGLQPSERADAETLVRRLYLDLIGLPPSPAEMDAFVQDDQPGAYGRLVEQLLRSPHFGEKWGRWWLDAARYADSDGYEKDKPREVWFYREWVIDAMNADKPYDRFIVEQIAGDLLPGAGQDDLVATGFLRNSMVNEEGGADPEQFRVEGMFDRVDAIGKAILGVTTQCAQCHTHKFDPLSHREYYQMFAALNGFHEAIATVYTPEDEKQRQEILQRIDEIEDELRAATPDWQEHMAAWEDQVRRETTDWQVVVPTEMPYEGQKFRLLADGSIISESYAPTRTTSSFSLTIQLKDVTGFRLEVLTHPQLPRGGPGRSIYGSGALTEFKVELAPADGSAKKQQVKWASATADVNPPHRPLEAPFLDKDPSKDDRVTGPIDYAIDGDNKTAWTTLTDPGRRNRNRNAVFVPEEPVSPEGKQTLTFHLVQNHGGWNSDDNQTNLLGRYRFSITSDPNPAADTLPAEVRRILDIPCKDRTERQQELVFREWRTSVAEFAQANEEIERLWESSPEGATQLVVQAREKPRKSFVFARGDFLSPTEVVTPGTPAFLGEMDDTPAPDRLDFARWLVDRDTPTTARAVVNRVWQAYFGQGLVLTPEDLGSQSQPPTHPELLDWLAVELMENGWSLNHIQRLIVNSAVYQQSSRLRDELLRKDPYNHLLARGPRFRVNAEVVRDIALTASGLLNRRVGGETVYPPAPAFLFEPPASYGPKSWLTSTGSEQYRRSIYVHQYRSVPFPPLQVFDAPKGDAACVRRTRSNTPLQALVLLNEPQFVECARAMAGRVLREAEGTDRDRLTYAHRLCVGRTPSDDELALLEEMLDSQRARLESGELDAAELLASPAAAVRRLTGQEPNEVAAWMTVSRVLLNLDETITKQ